jgi:hypothetical protein
VGEKRVILKRLHARKHDRRNTTAAKHYERCNRSAETQALPGQWTCRARHRKIYKLDVVGALKQWKTSGKAPEQIVVSESGNGKPDRKRLVCAYPQISQYKGSRSTDDPLNFACKRR